MRLCSLGSAARLWPKARPSNIRACNAKDSQQVACRHALRAPQRCPVDDRARWDFCMCCSARALIARLCGHEAAFGVDAPSLHSSTCAAGLACLQIQRFAMPFAPWTPPACCRPSTGIAASRFQAQRHLGVHTGQGRGTEKGGKLVRARKPSPASVAPASKIAWM